MVGLEAGLEVILEGGPGTGLDGLEDLVCSGTGAETSFEAGMRGFVLLTKDEVFLFRASSDPHERLL